MRKLCGFWVVLIALAVFWSGPVSAFSQIRSSAQRVYNPKTEITIKGTVEKVTEIGEPRWTGTHLMLRTSDQTYDVHVGPTAYLARNGFTFAVGDQIEVTGALIKSDGTKAIVAREIKKKGSILTLRDRRGIPVWSRGPRPID
ncbi:MAG: hypothetical protein ACP5FH_00140 [Terracidiphilus sp.]